VDVSEPAAWVYLLRCRDGSLYCGWTSDLPRRLRAHASGRASRYTASRLPVALAVAVPQADFTAARREEGRLKRLRRPAKEAWLAEVARSGDVGAIVPAHDDAALALEAELA